MGSSSNGVVSLVVVVMAALSLFSMVCMFQIDKLIRVDLYSFGLRFSNVWASPYLTMSKLVFLFGWMNIAAAISVHLYVLAFKRGEVRQLVTAVEAELSKKDPSISAGEKPVNGKPAGEKAVGETAVEATAVDRTLTKLLAEEHTDQKDTAGEKTADEIGDEETAAEETTSRERTDEKSTVEENPPLQPA